MDRTMLRQIGWVTATLGFTALLVGCGEMADGFHRTRSSPDGKPIMVSPVKEGEVMSVEECTRQIVTAMERRSREVVMTARGKIGLIIKAFAPSVIDRIAKRAVEKGR